MSTLHIHLHRATKDAGAFVSSKEIEQMLAQKKKQVETSKRNGLSTTVLQGQVAELEEELKKAKKREQTKDLDLIRILREAGVARREGWKEDVFKSYLRKLNVAPDSSDWKAALAEFNKSR